MRVLLLTAFWAVLVVGLLSTARANDDGFFIFDRRPVDGDICIPATVLNSVVQNLAPGIDVNGFMDSADYISRLSTEGVHVPKGDVLTFSFAGYPYVAVVSINEDGLACLNRSKPVEVDIHVRAMNGG